MGINLPDVFIKTMPKAPDDTIRPLNLPACNAPMRRLPTGEVQIYDPLRRKWLVLTPEEWVRQHFTAYLAGTKGYPVSLMNNEVALTLNGTRRRCDTVVFGRYGQPLVIVEYKAPSIAVSQRVFDQIVRYNMVLHARYLMVSNGLAHYCCRIDYDSHSYSFLKEIPSYPEISE